MMIRCPLPMMTSAWDPHRRYRRYRHYNLVIAMSDLAEKTLVTMTIMMRWIVATVMIPISMEVEQPTAAPVVAVAVE
jgi:hypothetical protein